MTSSGILSPSDIEAFRRDGYVVVRRLFDADEMDRIRRWTDEVASFPEVPGKHMMYFEESMTEPGTRILNRVEDFAPYHEDFAQLFDGPKMRDAVAQLFGEPVVLFKDKINFKLPGGDGFTPHQDAQAGWDTYASLYVTAMVTVDPTTVENGCLEMVAGHHQRGLIGAMWKPLSGADLDGMEFVRCPTAPGDAVFFDSFAPHQSGPNRTEQPRRVLYTTYNRIAEGDHRRQYYIDKRKNYPPDCEREPHREYAFRV